MGKRTLAFALILSSILVLFLGTVHTGTGHQLPSDELDTFRLVNDYVDDNEDCFKCHGNSKYQIKGEINGRVLTRHMYKDHVIPREDFYDEEYAHYQFEKIEEEYLQSMHHLANPEEFSCWKCHPHSYHISIRNTENLTATIAYDNAICLTCHADFDQFELLTDREGINIIQTHDWLPNQALHFQHVRCIECHTQISNSILVAHLVLPKEQAVRLCSECHSRDSRLMSTLYKFQSVEARNTYRFVNAVVINDAYVIGANRNYFLNVVSAVIFGLIFVGFALHMVLRIIKKV